MNYKVYMNEEGDLFVGYPVYRESNNQYTYKLDIGAKGGPEWTLVYGPKYEVCALMLEKDMDSAGYIPASWMKHFTYLGDL